MKQLFETRDGQQFESQVLALEHENELFEVWLKTPKLTIDIPSFLAVLDDSRDTEYYDTDRKIAKTFLRQLFEETFTDES